MTVYPANMLFDIAVKFADGPYHEWKMLGHDWCSAAGRW
jgi:hypothetical protein